MGVWEFDDRIATVQAILDERIAAGSITQVLEIGCGTRVHFNYPESVKVTGIDIDGEALDRNARLDRCLVGDFARYDHGDARYDCVVAWCALHIENPLGCIRTIGSLLNEGGIFILSGPNVLSSKGLITVLTPFWFHKLIHVHVFKKRHADGSLVIPWETSNSFALYPRAIKRTLRRSGMKPVMFRKFGSAWEKNIRNPLLRAGWKTFKYGLFALSLGMIDHSDTELLVIAEKGSAGEG